MSDWIVAPVMLPATVAPLLLLAGRFDLAVQRRLSIGATALLLAIALGLFVTAADGLPRAYLLGDWPAPFGIVLVLDRLAALMLLLTAILALVVVVHAAAGWDERGRHFHALFQFQLMGVNGAFLTGDIFNLFVFFEVLLIASYGLMLHGGGAARFKAGLHYVAVNLVGSTLFLFAVGLIYAVTGTLNMADLALKVPLVAAGDAAILRAGALLLLVVFAIKAALVPLHWWLPGTYAAASAPVAALFAIMTKVGAYAIIRVYTLIFGADGGAAAGIAVPWILPAALATLVVGTVGVLAARDLRLLVPMAVVTSMGTLLAAVGVFTAEALAASLYYLVHSTIAAATLFLLVDVIASRRGATADRLVPGPAFAGDLALGGLFFLAAIAMAGMPPLSGFLGKLLVLDALRGSPHWVAAWAVVLTTSLVTLVAFGRAGSVLFWSRTEGAHAGPPAPAAAAPVAGAATLVVLIALLTVLAGPAMALLEDVAAQLVAPHDYIRAVLGRAGPAVSGAGG